MSSSSCRRFSARGSVLHGPGALAELPSVLDAGARHVIVTDPGLVEAGLAARVTDILAEAKIAYHLFDGILPDPTIEQVEQGLEAARNSDCTAVIGLGGGSAIDAAKALAARMTWKTPLRRYGDGEEVPGPIAPLVAIPTTAGTGSEATRVAVITDPAKNEKMAIRGQALLPRAAVLDPGLLASLPPHIAAECGADALTHAIEALVSREADSMTDALALGAVEIIGTWLPKLVKRPSNEEAAEQMLLASNMAGQAFTHAGLGLAHSLGEPLGACCHISHGLACALFLPVVMDFNLDVATSRYARVGRALDPGAAPIVARVGARGAVDAVRSLFSGIGLPANYAEAEIDFELLQDMVDQVAPQYSTKCNPRSCSPVEAAELFRRLDR